MLPSTLILGVAICGLFICIKFLVEGTLTTTVGLRSETSKKQDSMTHFAYQIHYLKNRFKGLSYLFHGPEVIEKAYAQANGRPFLVATPSNNHVLVTTNELMREIADASPASLSLHAVAKELLQPKHTMHGFEWQNQRGLEGTGFVRALRSLLTSHLAYFQPSIDSIIRTCLREELSTPGGNGFTQVHIFPMMKRIVTRVNCFIFFGEELSQKAEFTAAALEFPQSVIFAAEILRITPSFLRSIVASLATGKHRAAKTLFRHLEPIVKERMAKRANPDLNRNSPLPVDCTQWLIDTSPRKNPWSPARMIGEIIAVWFSTVHQLSMTATYLIEDLCLHEEYLAPLKEELRQHVATSSKASIDIERLPLLDSFIKESIRCTNADAVSCRRKALVDHVLDDGTRVARGDWVCIPQRAMMHDPNRFSRPHEFDGFRFARANASLRAGNHSAEVPDNSPASLTTANHDWPIWGLGIAACPGRFYASLVLKLIVVQVLDEWECKLPDKDGPRSMVWRSSVVPRNDTRVLFRRQSERHLEAS
ncbi:hypothetical protein JX266_012218 [Neoarthrinium moseri]|nr:hypothetical protein JX266_012218 [Neoarthrinium moseri]